jgi:hyperosmotically inducible periplasmic protein
MKVLAVAIASAVALGLTACAQRGEQPSASGGQTTGIKQDAKDAALTGKVKSALAADVGLKTMSINVDSAGSVVTLKGQVDNAETKRRAEEVVRKVEGVTSVRNELTIKGG